MQETNRRLTDADLHGIQATMEIVLGKQREELGKEQYIRMDMLRNVLRSIDSKLERIVDLLVAATRRI